MVRKYFFVTNWLMRQKSGSASTALASFIAHAGIFEAPCSLIIYNESISVFLYIAILYRRTRQFFGTVSWRIFVHCKPRTSPKLKNFTLEFLNCLWALLHYGQNCLTMLGFSFSIFLLKKILNDLPTGVFTFQN